jgi:NAD(P)-dependent dehydrogenase (short-subunit alcohol dehydrogenase family)
MSDARTILVTGASSGIGLAAVRQLAAQGEHLILVSRDLLRGVSSRDEVARLATGGEPVFLPADLSSQQSIRKLAKELHARFSSIDVLINNAGTASRSRELTVDGLERTFATNHLGPFLLTELVLDLLCAAPAGRIVTTTSESHANQLDFDNLQGERKYSFFSAYARSKLANILFTYELARRLQTTDVTANCFTPGPTATNFGRGGGGAMGLMSELVHLIGKTPEQAARTAVYLATSEDVAGMTGQYFHRGRASRSKPVTYDDGVAARLWAISEELTRTDNGPPIKPLALERCRRFSDEQRNGSQRPQPNFIGTAFPCDGAERRALRQSRGEDGCRTALDARGRSLAPCRSALREGLCDATRNASAR